VVQHVGIATNVSVVVKDASSECHATVVSVVQQYDVRLQRTRSNERLGFTTLLMVDYNHINEPVHNDRYIHVIQTGLAVSAAACRLQTADCELSIKVTVIEQLRVSIGGKAPVSSS